jgi:hypothetical protein
MSQKQAIAMAIGIGVIAAFITAHVWVWVMT